MPTVHGSAIRSSSSRTGKPQHSVQLNIPGQQTPASNGTSGEHHHHHRDEAGSKTPSSGHHHGHQQHHHHHHHNQQALSRQLGLATLMALKRRLREARGRLQSQQFHASASRGRSENTYSLQPNAGAFQTPSVARQVLHNSLHFFLGDQRRYCPRASARLVAMVTDDAKRRLKSALGSHRFKIVVHACVMQKARQGAFAASRCLMDGTCWDNFANIFLETPEFLATATAYWFYHE